MSPRAACRLEMLGFSQAHDYVAGKFDWLAHNLPVDGAAAEADTIGRHLSHDVVTASLEEPLVDLRARVAASPHDFALVLATDTTLLGRLRGAVLETADPDSRTADVMEPGPATLRPDEPAARVRERLQKRNLRHAIITDPEGHLLGTVHRVALEGT